MVQPEDIGGGQIWRQPEFPCCVRYVVLLPGGKFALSSDPREQGNTLCTEPDGTWQWTPEDLADKFTSHKYECDGQLGDLILESITVALNA